jgi:hypothetical protein
MSPRWSRRLRGLALPAAWAAAVACGPSYQALYEGDARFEHCYALEENGAATMGQKGDCWRDWTARYTYGQTRDRVEYAYARYRALSRAPQAPTDEAMMQAAPGEGRSSSVAAPAPTNAFAPPPKTMADTEGRGPVNVELPDYTDAGAGPVTVTSVVEEKTPLPPGTACKGTCDIAWARCTDTAKCDGGGCDSCARDYKKCVRGCFAK